MNTPDPRNLRLIRPGDPPPPGGDGPPRLRTAWTAAELMAENFPPPRWAVPGLIAEGVNLLAGPPKVGKSWLSLGLALAVAAGTPALGSVEVEAGPVLYLALEDTPRRLQTRMRRILDHHPAPASLHLATMCPPLPEGGAAAIAGWLGRNPAARMVVIDVFAKVRGRPAPGSVSAYDADYAAIGYAKRLADEHAVAVVLVHHVRKAAADDFLAEVSGTNGLAGAADATLVLKRPRGEADGILYVTGRDVDEAEHAMRFTPETGTWALLSGPAADYTVSGTRAAILRHLRASPGSTPRAISDATGIGYDNVKKACQRMAADGQLTADTAGRYRPAGTPVTPESVPAVPGVPEPLPTWENAGDEWGHEAETGVPGVPAPPDPFAAYRDLSNPVDALAHGLPVPGGPGACARCGHLTLWHGAHGRYRGKPCTKCDCPAYTDQEKDQ